jgi:sulfotransferase
VRGLFDNYHNGAEVAFNTNRGWGLLLSTVKAVYPEAKVLMCVRDIGWILDSFEVLQRKNPMSFTSMFSVDENTNVYTRCEALLGTGRTLGFAYQALRQALVSEHKSSIMLIDYDTLASRPEWVMKAVYNFIGEQYFEHDFDNVAASYDEFDEDVQLPGLHTTRPQVSLQKRETILPDDVWQRVKGMEVWKK